MFTLISDIDGILTNGEHIYSSDKKEYKVFGSNDRDAIEVLKTKFKKIIFCSADKSGEEINKLRISEIGAEYVFCPIKERQELINQHFPCIYLGDGINEPKAHMNFTLMDSTPQAKKQADVILPTIAGKNVFPYLLDYWNESEIYNFAVKIKNNLKNKIILAGVGKNFSLAQLVSEFFLPFNLIAIPLDANHSLHGSLGLIQKDDIFIVSSKSGNTKELIDMMIALNDKILNFDNSFFITSNKEGKCNKFFKHVLVLDSLKEDSLFGLSPQTTIEQYLKVYFKILNILTTSHNLSKEEYLLNHQGGSIGGKDK